MTNLECAALHCANNHNRLCNLSGITVQGANACHGRETCCASFSDETSAFSNALGGNDATPETNITCDAHRCIYNTDGMCEAEDVLIDGSFARQGDATCCDSFLARD